MKSCYTKSLLLSVGVLWVASAAHAQTGASSSPSLLALPESGPQLQGYAPVSYNAAGRVADPQYGPAVARRQVEPEPVYPSTSPEQGSMPADSNGKKAASVWDESNGKASCGGEVFDEALGPCWSHGCSECISSCNPRWFGSIGGLIMNRNNPNAFWTTFRTNVNALQLMETRQARDDWQGGGEVSIGRWFGCCATTGLEVSYWTIDPMKGFTHIVDPNNTLSTPIDLGGVNIGLQTAASFFDNAAEHRIWREDHVQNIEINLLQRQVMYTGNFNATWLAGVRYFRFDENLTFGSVAGGFSFGQNGGVDEAYLRSRVTSNLIGAQLGVRGDYLITPRIGLFATPKIGIYGNSMDSRNELFRGDGLHSFDITGHKNDFSMIGQIDLGANYQFAKNWRAYAGYRAMAVTGIALADNQFLPFMADAAGFANIKSNGDLILHGGMGGVEWRF